MSQAERLAINDSKVYTGRIFIFNPKLSLTNDNFARRADNSFYTNELSGLTPTLKLTGILTLNKKAKSLSFNVGPEGKKGLTAFLGLKDI
ncbi:MAG: hypothetical protein EA359_12495, partial [Balneolaceae bacterium]